MTTPHIEAQPGDYAETVLLPGDPLRAKYISEYFDDVKQVNGVRGCYGYTGYHKGKKISVQASGMGHASLGIYVHELYSFYGVKNIIRVGTCGGISPNVKVGDIVVQSSVLKPINATKKYYLNTTDEYPILFIISALTRGNSFFSGISDLKNKESDRIKEMQKILKQFGVFSKFKKDKLVIKGKRNKKDKKKIYVSNLGTYKFYDHLN